MHHHYLIIKRKHTIRSGVYFWLMKPPRHLYSHARFYHSTERSNVEEHEMENTPTRLEPEGTWLTSNMISPFYTRNHLLSNCLWGNGLLILRSENVVEANPCVYTVVIRKFLHIYVHACTQIGGHVHVGTPMPANFLCPLPRHWDTCTHPP